MTLTNCPRCGKLFPKMSTPICDACVKEEEKLFDDVRDYVKENPEKSLAQVSEATGASIKKIMRYVQDGRLELSIGMNAERPLRCGKCGKPITVGLYCDTCLIEINQSVTDMFGARKSTGMHSIKNDDQDRRR